MTRYLFPLCALALLASCSGRSKKTFTDSDSIILAETPEIRFEGYSYDMIAEITDADSIDADGWRYCRVSGQGVMPNDIEGHNLSKLRDTLAYLAGVRYLSPAKVDPTLEPGLKPTNLDPTSTPACSNTYKLLSVSLLTPQLVVWRAYQAAYPCMAAHGAYRTDYINYRVADGTILSLEDIVAPEMHDSLTRRIRERLVEDKVDLLVPVDSINIPSDFQLSTNGVNFIYGIYEVAPFSAGEVSVGFDAYEIEDLLKPGILSLIYGNPME